MSTPPISPPSIRRVFRHIWKWSMACLRLVCKVCSCVGPAVPAESTRYSTVQDPHTEKSRKSCRVFSDDPWVFLRKTPQRESWRRGVRSSSDMMLKKSNLKRFARSSSSLQGPGILASSCRPPLLLDSQAIPWNNHHPHRLRSIARSFLSLYQGSCLWPAGWTNGVRTIF